MSDIFISYASEDRARVKPFVEALEKRGWSVWWDRTILPGKTWEDVIEAAIHEARCIVVLWSQSSVKSDWVRKEARTGRARGILVPALIDDVPVPWAFNEIQAANLVGWAGEAPNAEFVLFVEAISALLPVKASVQEKASAASAGGGPAPSHEAAPQVVEVPKPFRWEAQSPRSRPAFRLSFIVFSCVLLLGVVVWWIYSATHPSPKPIDPTPEHVGLASPPPKSTKVNPKDGLTYVWIPAGKFMMGCSPGDSECYDDEKPAREVSVPKGFWLGQTEVTQAAWKRVMGGENPSHFKGDDRPVESITQSEAKQYCEESLSGGRLPTEAEWEYGGRAGTTAVRYGDLDRIAWHSKNSSSQTHDVKTKEQNAWGLHDMLGNVWEWVDGQADLRGGSWNVLPRGVRVSDRYGIKQDYRGSDVGFRCAGESGPFSLFPHPFGASLP